MSGRIRTTPLRKRRGYAIRGEEWQATGPVAPRARTISVNEKAPTSSFCAAACGLAKSRAIGDEASSGAAFTIIHRV
ncbi:MAG: hypothetical protein EBT35_05220 [Alphaproteobacteria bacterium]|nr:hypothetical protein [Alphaproteobacteria bacterium]